MEKVLFLMIPVLWGALVLGLGTMAWVTREWVLKREEKNTCRVVPKGEGTEKSEEAFY